MSKEINKEGSGDHKEKGNRKTDGKWHNMQMITENKAAGAGGILAWLQYQPTRVVFSIPGVGTNPWGGASRKRIRSSPSVPYGGEC